MRFLIDAHTNLGNGREVNEDAFAYCPFVEDGKWIVSRTMGNPKSVDDSDTGVFQQQSSLGSLLVVADGMGGASAGEVASAMAISTIQRLCSVEEMRRLAKCRDGEVHQFFKNVVLQADKEIRAYTLEHFETIGMGTTLVIAWVREGKADVIWCGDSRAYCYTPSGGLQRITTDHSYVQELCTRGEITADEMLTHPDSNLLTRCVGDTDFEARADAVTVTLQPNTLLMLCTDGLSGYSYEQDVERTIYRNFVSARIPLVEMALQLEAQDNITVLTLSLIGDKEDQPSIPFTARLKNLF